MLNLEQRQRFAGEMNELRAYLLARLPWNPDLDWRAERREFCAAYYGVEAGHLIDARTNYREKCKKIAIRENVNKLPCLAFVKEKVAFISPRAG